MEKRYLTYVMALYTKNGCFRGIKVGSTTKSANIRKSQILNSETPNLLNFNKIIVWSVNSYTTPHLMYAAEALLHQAASEIKEISQERADYFTMSYGKIRNANNYEEKILQKITEQHTYITNFLTKF